VLPNTKPMKKIYIPFFPSVKDAAAFKLVFINAIRKFVIAKLNNESTSYSCVDKNTCNGNSYYRIKSIDINGYVALL
jgi:hypothetical protein